MNSLMRNGRFIVTLSRGHSTKPTYVPNDQFLHRGIVKVESQHGDVEVNSVWQDSMPTGSAVGTVVALHGAPGSHNDFKYIEDNLRLKGIRTVGMDLPGFGYTEASPKLLTTNEDRDSYITALIDQLKLDNIIWLGHSRGTENCIRGAVRHSTRSRGIALCNPTGLRIHRGIDHQNSMKAFTHLYDHYPILHPILLPIIDQVYKRIVKLHLEDPRLAVHCLKTMLNCSLEKMVPFVQDFQKEKHLKSFVVYSGKDALMQQEIPREMMSEFEDWKEMIARDSSDAAEVEAIAFVKERFASGARSTSVFVEKDGHFQQKKRARLVADAIEAMLKK